MQPAEALKLLYMYIPVSKALYAVLPSNQFCLKSPVNEILAPDTV